MASLSSTDEAPGVAPDHGSPVGAVPAADDVLSDAGSTTVGGHDAQTTPAPFAAGTASSSINAPFAVGATSSSLNAPSVAGAASSSLNAPFAAGAASSTFNAPPRGTFAMPGVPHIPIPTFIRYGFDNLTPDFSMHTKEIWWGGAVYRVVPGTVVLESSHGATACTIVPATCPVPFRSSVTGINMGYVHVRPVTLFRQSQTPGNDAHSDVNFAQPLYCFSVEFICSAMDGLPSRVLYETVISAPPLMPPPAAILP